MITLTSTQSLEVLLGAAIATNQLNVVASYVNIDTSGEALTPGTTLINTNSTTAVEAVAAPSSGQQRQLKFLSVYNTDTATATVTVRVHTSGSDYIVIRVILLSGEQLQYSPENGWIVLDAQGGLKKTLGYPESQFLQGNIDAANITGTLTLTNGTSFATWLGRTGKEVSRVSLIYRLTTVVGATISYAEAAIFKGDINLGGNPTLTRLGFADISGPVANGGGQTIVQVTLSTPARPGDNLWAVIGASTSGTQGVIRAGLGDDIQTGAYASISGRPSTITSPTAWTIAANDAARPWIQGFLG